MSDVCSVRESESEEIFSAQSGSNSFKLLLGKGFTLEFIVKVLRRHSDGTRQSRLRNALIGYCHIDFLRYIHNGNIINRVVYIVNEKFYFIIQSYII